MARDQYTSKSGSKCSSATLLGSVEPMRCIKRRHTGTTHRVCSARRPAPLTVTFSPLEEWLAGKDRPSTSTSKIAARPVARPEAAPLGRREGEACEFRGQREGKGGV